MCSQKNLGFQEERRGQAAESESEGRGMPKTREKREREREFGPFVAASRAAFGPLMQSLCCHPSYERSVRALGQQCHFLTLPRALPPYLLCALKVRKSAIRPRAPATGVRSFDAFIIAHVPTPHVNFFFGCSKINPRPSGTQPRVA